MTPSTRGSIFERIAVGFADSFGTPGSFTLWAVLAVAWLALIPFLGLAHWNSGPGLAGNTVESTAELFLEIAILYKANRIDSKTEAHRDEVLARIARTERRIELLEERILAALESPTRKTTLPRRRPR